MPHASPEARRQYQREWRARQPREAEKQRVSDNAARYRNYRARRRELLSQFPCVSCHETNPDVIQWHHVEGEAEFRLFSGSQGEDRWWDEVLNCGP